MNKQKKKKSSGCSLQAPLFALRLGVSREYVVHTKEVTKGKGEERNDRRKTHRSAPTPYLRSWRNPCGIVDFFTVCSGIVPFSLKLFDPSCEMISGYVWV